jgi:hypothetical protein
MCIHPGPAIRQNRQVRPEKAKKRIKKRSGMDRFYCLRNISGEKENYCFFAMTSPLMMRDVLPSVAFDVTTIDF